MELRTCSISMETVETGKGPQHIRTIYVAGGVAGGLRGGNIYIYKIYPIKRLPTGNLSQMSTHGNPTHTISFHGTFCKLMLRKYCYSYKIIGSCQFT